MRIASNFKDIDVQDHREREILPVAGRWAFGERRTERQPGSPRPSSHRCNHPKMTVGPGLRQVTRHVFVYPGIMTVPPVNTKRRIPYQRSF